MPISSRNLNRPRLPLQQASQIIIDDIVVAVVRKPIKTLRLTVSPPDGRVSLSVPLRTGEEVIRTFLLARLDWIRKHRRTFADRSVVPPLEYCAGERHLFAGTEYPLSIVDTEGSPSACQTGEGIVLHLRPGSDRNKRQQLLFDFYRRHLLATIPLLIARWEERLNVAVSSWGIRRMRSRWGSCNVAARRLSFNLELARTTPLCLEYVVIHEMVHLLERSHGPRFIALMDCFCPDWRERRVQLNRTIPAQGDRVV